MDMFYLDMKIYNRYKMYLFSYICEKRIIYMSVMLFICIDIKSSIDIQEPEGMFCFVCKHLCINHSFKNRRLQHKKADDDGLLTSTVNVCLHRKPKGEKKTV